MNGGICEGEDSQSATANLHGHAAGNGGHRQGTPKVTCAVLSYSAQGAWPHGAASPHRTGGCGDRVSCTPTVHTTQLVARAHVWLCEGFSDACMTGPSTRSDSRRQRSAKARNRGEVSTRAERVAYGDLTGRAVIAVMDAEGGLLACLEGSMRETAARPRSREQRRAKGAIGWELLGGGGMMAHRSAVPAPDQRGERMALRC